MAEQQVSTGATKGKPDRLFDNKVLVGLSDAVRFADQTHDRLELILYGLKEGDQALYGAKVLLRDILLLINEEQDRLEELEAFARASEHFMPRTEMETKLLATVASAQGGLESNFICQAGFLAQRVYRESRFKSPEARNLSEIMRQVWAELKVEDETPSCFIDGLKPCDPETSPAGEGEEVTHG